MRPEARTQPLHVLLPPLLALGVCAVALRFAPTSPAADADWAMLLMRLAATASWLAGAWLLVRLLEVLVWERLVPRRGSLRIPRLLRQLVAVLLFLLTVALLLNQVWGLALLPMMATTGAVGIVAGLALRNLLADFFSGIALNMEHPFRLDDFVLLHVRGKREPVIGFVREVNWRSTTVLTPEDNLISVPNSAVAEATVENLSFPSPVSELELEIVLDWTLDTTRVEAVLAAANLEAWLLGATSGDKPPKFRIRRLDGAGVAYKIVYLIDPRRKPKGPARHALLTCLHRHLRFAGLRPVPAGVSPSGRLPPPQRFLDADLVADRRRVLDQIDLLSVLTPAERDRVAEGVRVLRVQPGMAVVRQGEPGTSMYLVAAGLLEVTVRNAGGATVRSPPVAPGGFFGEMSLLTGEPRTASVSALCPSVLYELPAELMAELLASRPALAESLSRAVTEHRRQDADDLLKPAADPVREPSLAEALAARIRSFFASRISP